MGAFEKKKKKGSGAMIAAVILTVIVLAAVLVMYILARDMEPGEPDRLPEETLPKTTEQMTQTEEPSTGAPTEVTEETAAPGADYPAELEDGRLILESLFQFDGMNPDCNMENGSSIAAVILENASEEFLLEARLELELADGTAVEFFVTNLPAGKKTMAFSVDNTMLDEDAVCVNVSCDAVWGKTAEAMPETVSVSVDGTAITVRNLTDQEIPALTVYCRDPFNESYFGGKTQEYTINNLSANGTVTVQALESIMGLTEVVRIVIHE